VEEFDPIARTIAVIQLLVGLALLISVSIWAMSHRHDDDSEGGSQQHHVQGHEQPCG
jgi:hypothetical protein